MKIALLGVVGIALVAGCGDDNGGVFLDLSATGHVEGSQVEIVLASADAAKIALGIDQRLDPTRTADSPVDLYRQRAKGGTVATTAIDGFTVKIEPDDTVADDEQFVPIALVHGPSGDITAIGTVEDENGALFKMPVRSAKPAFVTMNVRPIAPNATANVDAMTGGLHYCANDPTTPSGLVWNPPNEHQVRLLLPLTGTDASEIPFDMDCDGKTADDDLDCDDLDPDTFPGALEACDGKDTACDGNGFVEEPCTFQTSQTCVTPQNANGSVMTGVAVCDEDEGTVRHLGGAQGCYLPRTCTNTMIGRGGACTLTSAMGGASDQIESCSAAIGQTTVCAGNCTVEVGVITGDLEVKLSNTQNGSFGSDTVAIQGKIYVRVKDNTGTYTRPAPTHLGRVLLVVNAADASVTAVYAVDFKLDGAATTPECERPSNGNALMTCTQ